MVLLPLAVRQDAQSLPAKPELWTPDLYPGQWGRVCTAWGSKLAVYCSHHLVWGWGTFFSWEVRRNLAGHENARRVKLIAGGLQHIAKRKKGKQDSLRGPRAFCIYPTVSKYWKGFVREAEESKGSLEKLIDLALLEVNGLALKMYQKMQGGLCDGFDIIWQ